jgi:outer membrane protein assembly factor BamB
MSIGPPASRPVRCALTAFVALLALTSACATSGTRGHTGTGTASSTLSALPSASPVTAYFGGGDRVYALDGRTGAVKWTYTTGHGVGAGGITDTVVLAGVVFFHGTDVDAAGHAVRALYALDAARGTKRWELLSTAPAGELNGLMIANPDAVVGGTVFLVAPGGQVPSGTYALDLASGKLLWGADGLGAEAVTIGDHAVYVTQMLGASSVQGPSDEILTALDPATGNQLWQLHGVSGALLSGGLLYGVSLGSPAALSALDAATGATRWTRPIAGEILDFNIVGPTLFVGDPSSMSALDPATGQLRWRYAIPGAAAWYMHIGGRGATSCLEYHDQNGTHLAGVDAATGAQRWARAMAAPSGGVSYGSGYGDDSCYVRTDQPNAGGSALSRLDAATGATRWTIDAGGQVVGALDIFTDAIYAQTSVDRLTSTVKAFSVADGATLWQVTPDMHGFLGQLAVE